MERHQTWPWNICGDIVFEGERARACVLHPAKIDVATVEDILSEYEVETVRLDPNPCKETQLQSQDVLVANRGELLKQPTSYLAPLFGQVEDGTFQELKTLSDGEFEKVANASKDKAIEIENKIETGIDGYGLVEINNGSAVICMTTVEQEAAHRALINDHRKILLRFFSAPPEIQRMTLEDAFISAKRGKCGGDLRQPVRSLQSYSQFST